MINKKQKRALEKMVKDILKDKSDDVKNGYNVLYKTCKREGYSDEQFYKELFTHMGFVKTNNAEV